MLLDLLALRPWWEQHEVRWVCVPAPDTLEVLSDAQVAWVDELFPSRPLEVLRGVRRARDELRRWDIDLVVSAGSGVAVPYFLAARLGRVPAWWLETLNITGRPGLAARLCARLAQRVLVQRSELLADHRRAVNVGELY